MAAGKRRFVDRTAEIRKRDQEFIEQQAKLLPQLYSIEDLKHRKEEANAVADTCQVTWRKLQKIRENDKFDVLGGVFDIYCEKHQIGPELRSDALQDEEQRLNRTIIDLKHFQYIFGMLSDHQYAVSKLDIVGRHIFINTVRYMRETFGGESAPRHDGSDTDLYIIIELIYAVAGVDAPARETLARWQRQEVPPVKGGVPRK